MDCDEARLRDRAIDDIRVLYETHRADPLVSLYELKRSERFSWLNGLDAPLEIGGSNLGFQSIFRVFSEAGMLDPDLRDMAGLGHARILSLVYSQYLWSFLREVIEGTAYCAIAITEKTPGSNISAISTVATRCNNGYEITGEKRYIARLHDASHAIVFCKVDSPDNPRLTVLLVPLDTDGVTAYPIETYGLQETSFGGLLLDKVWVPASHRVGGEGEGKSLFTRHFCYWRTCVAALALGVAKSELQSIEPWLSERRVFELPLANMTHVQQCMAKHYSRLRMSEAFVQNIGAQFESGSLPVLDSSIAKAEVIEFSLCVVDWAVRLRGARVFSTSNSSLQKYESLIGLSVADGTTDLLRSQVARALLGEDNYMKTYYRRYDD